MGIVSPAGKLPLNTDTAKIRERFASWGLHVKFGVHCADREQPYFAGTDEERAADLQAMIDDPSVKAVIACRGGYGSVRLLPLADLARLREEPKWVVGFSDITMLHLALRKLRIESIHGPMPSGFRFDGEEDPRPNRCGRRCSAKRSASRSNPIPSTSPERPRDAWPGAT